MQIWKYIIRPPFRTIILLLAVAGSLCLAYLAWSPGEHIHTGQHDLRTNGIWIQHGWLGDDTWFQSNKRNKKLFRNDHEVKTLRNLFKRHGIKYIFPHVCPSKPTGEIASVDPVQTERFLDHFADFDVIPWIGGVLNKHCKLESTKWRSNFVSSIAVLFQSHPRFAGIQLNIEPLPTGNAHFLVLLDEIRQALPADKIISVAAFPPPSLWHPFPQVHWDESYFKQVAQRADQIVPMMYDTAIKLPKFYQHTMSKWTLDILDWAGNAQVLLGVPAYDDAGVGYHLPEVENLENALSGIHAGLSKHTTLPKHYAGISIYCEWEMSPQEWGYFMKAFESTP